MVKGTVPQRCFQSNITFSSPTSFHFSTCHHPNNAQNGGLSEPHCTGLTHINNCLRVIPKFYIPIGLDSFQTENTMGKRNTGISKETLNLEAMEGHDIHEILQVSSHSQPSLSEEMVSVPKKGQIPKFLPR